MTAPLDDLIAAMNEPYGSQENLLQQREKAAAALTRCKEVMAATHKFLGGMSFTPACLDEAENLIARLDSTLTGSTTTEPEK